MLGPNEISCYMCGKSMYKYFIQKYRLNIYMIHCNYCGIVNKWKIPQYIPKQQWKKYIKQLNELK